MATTSHVGDVPDDAGRLWPMFTAPAPEAAQTLSTRPPATSVVVQTEAASTSALPIQRAFYAEDEAARENNVDPSTTPPVMRRRSDRIPGEGQERRDPPRRVGGRPPGRRAAEHLGRPNGLTKALPTPSTSSRDVSWRTSWSRSARSARRGSGAEWWPCPSSSPSLVPFVH